MIRVRCHLVRLLAAAAALGPIGFVHAQVGMVLRVPAAPNAPAPPDASALAPPPIDDDVVEDEQAPQQQQTFAISDENFEMWVYGGNRNYASARSRLESLLTLNIENLDRTCGMTEPQKKKLQLAGRGDMKRFLDKVAEKKRVFDSLKHDQNRINEIFQEIQPLQTAFNAGLFNDGSIYAKAVKNCLTPEQTEKFESLLRQKNQFRYRARVDLVVSMLDNSVGFSADQRKAFVKLLVEETKPPKKFGQYDTQVVLLQAANIPQDKLKPLFDDAQWRVLNRQLTQARGMEQHLRQNGILPDKEKPAPKPKPGLSVGGVR